MPKTLTEEQAAAIEQAFNTPLLDEEKLLAKFAELAKADLPEDAKNAIKGALRLLGKYKDAVGEDVLKKLASLAGFGYAPPEPAKKAADQDGGDADKKKSADPKDKPDLKKGEDDALQVELKKRDDLIEKQQGEIAELKKFQAQSIADREDREVNEMVDEMGLGGMAREDQIKLLKSMTPEQRKALEQWAPGLKKNADLPGMIGTPKRGDPTTSAYEEALARARSLVQKDATGKTTDVAALDQVLKDDPDLARRYRVEVRGG